jgi:hypothetical protein
MIPLLTIIDRTDIAVGIRNLLGDSLTEIMSKSRDPAEPRQIIAKESDTLHWSGTVQGSTIVPESPSSKQRLNYSSFSSMDQ